jgi:hypothetical protein
MYSVETIAGQQVLLPFGQAVIDGGMVYHLNETAAWVLTALEQETSLDSLLNLAADRFQAKNERDRETLREDITAFVDQLRRLCLLEE